MIRIPIKSKFVTVAMNRRLRVGILRDLLQRIFLANGSNILYSDLILVSKFLSSSSGLVMKDPRCLNDSVYELYTRFPR